jgi:hypothetical protein
MTDAILTPETEDPEEPEVVILGNARSILGILADHDIDLGICEIETDCASRRYVHYLDRWQDNDDPHIQLTFYHACLTPENRRSIKRLTGQLRVGEGSRPDLFGEVTVDGIRLEFRIKGSYECTTHCYPKGDFQDVRDEMTAPVVLEEKEGE